VDCVRLCGRATVRLLLNVLDNTLAEESLAFLARKQLRALATNFMNNPGYEASDPWTSNAVCKALPAWVVTASRRMKWRFPAELLGSKTSEG